MGLLTWVLVPLAIAAMLAARYHEAGLSDVHLCALFAICFLTLLLYQRSKSFGWHLVRPSSPNSAVSTRINVPLRKVNNSLYEIYRAEGNPTVQVLFFHGLQSVEDSDAHVSTWKSEDGSLIWPREWLAQAFPGAHIFTVSYNQGVRNFDMVLVGENLTSDLMDGGIGQVPYCPVMLVGYCVGGLVLKQICLQARKKFFSGKTSTIDKEKLGRFLDNVKGIFYYGTPHRGSSVIDNIADGPLFKYFKVLNKKAARLNSDFDDLRVSYPKWKVYGLGESVPTISGLFQSLVVAVPEGTSREGDEFHVVEADHNSICQPRNKVDRRFYALKNLIDSILINVEDEKKVREKSSLQDAHPDNFQLLPEEIVGMDAQVQVIVGKLVRVRKLGFAGMGGLGKTTLAKAVFNHLCSRFEYTCFVPDMKLIAGSPSDAMQAIWEQMHHHGKKVGRESSFRGKELLLVLDDISLRDEKVLRELAHASAPESRFVATSRNEDYLSNLDEVFDVPFLQSKNAEELFIRYAFPNQAVPPLELQTVMNDIIEKCDRLPLTLEVLGKYLKRKRDVEHWEQTLSALKNAEEISSLNERLWEKLRPSFDDLSYTEKQIFLDAATFFSTIEGSTFGRWTLREAKAAWRAAYGGSEQLLWQTLVDRSLVYSVGENDTIKLHEQLQSLGQKIAREPSNISKCRVFDGKVGLKMLQNTTEELGGQEIHALRVDLGSPFSPPTQLPKAALSKLKKVQFFEADGPVTIDGSRDGASVLTEVVLLGCVGQHLFNPDRQIRLAVLDLNWPLEDPLPSSIGQLERLKHLKINYYLAGTVPSTFGQLRSLQRLTINFAVCLESLPESFGQLSSLNYLKFVGCLDLHSLPESFGDLKELHSLEFTQLEKLESLPASFGRLRQLQSLKFNSCSKLTSLPESFGQLKALHLLQLRLCPVLIRLPESFGQLITLTDLELQCQNLRYLPESFGHLTKLQRLATDVNIESLPDSVGNFKALRDLVIGYYSASSIPDWIKFLPSLETLTLFFHRDMVEPLPPWLMTPNVPSKLSSGARILFRVLDGGFFLSLKRDAIDVTRMKQDLSSLLELNAKNSLSSVDFSRKAKDILGVHIEKPQ